MVAIYGRSVEILLDREISQIEDISKIFSDKVMGEKAITRCFELGKEIRSATVRGQTLVEILSCSKNYTLNQKFNSMRKRQFEMCQSIHEIIRSSIIQFLFTG